MTAVLTKSLIDTLKAPHFPIYMDYSATTPVDPRVAEKMIPFLRAQFGNPASRSHAYGWDAEEIHAAHPHLPLAQIHAALSYYHDHKAAFDAQIARQMESYQKLRAEAPSQVTRAELQARLGKA